jgi:toxin-antitoxin system PIN domain toxin
MLALDVNVLVPAFRADAPDHAAMRGFLESSVNATEPVGLTDAVLAGVVRVLTHPKVFTPPSPLDHVLTACGDLVSHPGTVRLLPGTRHWEIFTRLCVGANAKGNLVADAQHAAIAIENGATWISKDRDFARFAGLRWRHPLD